MSQRRCRILVVDDESAIREVLHARLTEWGYSVRTVASVRDAIALIGSYDPDVVITDLVMSDATGMTLLETLRAGVRERSVIMITAYGTIGGAVQAMKSGAIDFLTKPLDYAKLRRLIEDIAARLAEAPVEQRVPDAEVAGPPGFILGRSPAMARMWASITMAAATTAAVLIVGESGSGKELVARTIHDRSARAAARFVPINASAIPEALAEGELFGAERGAFTGATEARAGLIELAHRGTLFLDEITEMLPSLQPKLLRVLEDGVVRRVGGRVEMVCDARFIAATNRQPQEAVAQGRLRADLLYRLDVMRVDVPPLRDRREDIAALAEHFLAACATRYGGAAGGLEPAALAELEQHAWPGNVRELRNAIERAYAAARGASISVQHLRSVGFGEGARAESEPLGIVIPHGVTAAAAERIVILETLKATDNNKTEAARRLGIDVKTIRNKLKLFGDAGEDS